MITILYEKSFLKEFKKMPKKIQVKLIYLEDIFRVNCFHPSLHTKKLQGELKHFYSFRITRDYRVVFELVSKDEAAFIAAKHRKDIYR